MPCHHISDYSDFSNLSLLITLYPVISKSWYLSRWPYLVFHREIKVIQWAKASIFPLKLTNLIDLYNHFLFLLTCFSKKTIPLLSNVILPSELWVNPISSTSLEHPFISIIFHLSFFAGFFPFGITFFTPYPSRYVSVFTTNFMKKYWSLSNYTVQSFLNQNFSTELLPFGAR